MKTWGKIILFSMPFLFILIFLIVARQHKTNQAIRRQNASFQIAWNNFNSPAPVSNPTPASPVVPAKPAKPVNSPRKEVSKKVLNHKINNLMKNF